MRILHVIHSVNPANGGPIEGVKQLSIVNEREGHSVELLSLDSPEDPWVTTSRFTCHAVGPGLGGYGYSPRMVRWLRANRRIYDVVVVNGIWQFSSYGVWLALRGTATPYFVFTHGMLDPWFKHTYPLKHLKKWLYWPWAEYRVLRDATAVLFTCEEERRLARQSFWLYKCDESVVNYGTAGPVGDPAEQRRLFLQAFPLTAGKRCLIFLGRLHEKKGADLLIACYRELLSRSPNHRTADIHLIIAGPHDHAYGRQLKAEAEAGGIGDRITWTGMLEGDLKWGAFYASEAFILPSHQENFGIAVTEALACGLPVFISNKVNIWREILQFQAGVVESDDLEGTRRLMDAWLQMPPEEIQAMRRRAKDCFTQRFHVDQTASMFIRLLNTFGLFGLKARTGGTAAPKA